MNIYYLEQDDNQGYDTFDSCVVIAENEENARTITPADEKGVIERNWKNADKPWFGWAKKPENVKVTYIGSNENATEEELICASFNAG